MFRRIVHGRSLIYLLWIPLSVALLSPLIHQDAHAQTTQTQLMNRKMMDAALTRDGWRAVVCDLRLYSNRYPFCLHVGDLSKVEPQLAVAIGDWLRADAVKWASSQHDPLKSDTILERYLQGTRVVGCFKTSNGAGVDVLSYPDAGRYAPFDPRILQTMFETCAMRGTASPLSVAIQVANADAQDLEAFLDAYLKLTAPKSPETQKFAASLMKTTSPPALWDYVGRAWAAIQDAVGGRDRWDSGADDALGVPGMCLMDEACAATDKSMTAASEALAEVMRTRYADQLRGCVPSATPTPDSPDPCFRLSGATQLSASFRDKLWLDACRLRLTVAHTIEGAATCPTLRQPVVLPPSICNDPHALCTPEGPGSGPVHGTLPPGGAPSPQPIPIQLRYP